MTIDFTNLNKLAVQNANYNEKEGNVAEEEGTIIPKLQHKVDLIKKKDDWYREVLVKNQEVKSEVQVHVSTLLKMIEEQATIKELFATAFSKLLNLTGNLNFSEHIREHIQYLALKKQNDIARVVAYEDLSLRLRNLNQAHNNNPNEDIGSKMRRESAIKKHEELMKLILKN
ncbi:hypothetical protein [Streptococcus equi]|uniref:hypothetical protein n=1 Tax=Streptococcus equi TaxID=1336 RepID=UPI0013F5E4DE|nr:hypothetical protein [Streptococcus equi]MDI5990282.1 hypothetical protein [Streptococcus equi subsp. zooepidemicus]HEL0697976.1 hypothetical protein [Streptococcus equi subsp. zooepidemicus]HEL0807450.1 hypothetical protein [Streptococcus equi subsp. zooepidemicus]HEL1073953.1 hypothetical protein [Streptococcus equi subsp. zooepidemicus]HEL1116295.1 hypothetical protein [Streptococcus equi subsp. zooepidemicus]